MTDVGRKLSVSPLGPNVSPSMITVLLQEVVATNLN